jgi:hypothetical protein
LGAEFFVYGAVPFSVRSPEAVFKVHVRGFLVSCVLELVLYKCAGDSFGCAFDGLPGEVEFYSSHTVYL